MEGENGQIDLPATVQETLDTRSHRDATFRFPDTQLIAIIRIDQGVIWGMSVQVPIP